MKLSDLQLRLMISRIGRSLGCSPHVLIGAIHRAFVEHSDKPARGFCKVCHKPILYDDEYKYALVEWSKLKAKIDKNRGRDTLDNYWSIRLLQRWGNKDEYARRSAKIKLTMGTICPHCRNLKSSFLLRPQSTRSFFEALAFSHSQKKHPKENQ